MKSYYYGICLLLLSHISVFAQKGVLVGRVTDTKTGEELIGATIVIDGTIQGTITDFTGGYFLQNIEPGTYTFKCQFISYEPKVVQNVVIKAGEETTLDFQMGAAEMNLEEVKVVAKANRASETMLLLDQKKATVIKESIGAKRLASLGVSDAAAAATKISGVTKNEGSGDIYIRGLGDRYLTTTMNGLPIPSDDVEKKNIDLNLFSTDVIENVGINKTYGVDTYADQTSGAVDVTTKSDSKKIAIGVTGGANTNIIQDGNFGNFKATQNYNDVTLGFYSQPYTTTDAITNQSWKTVKKSTPVNYDFSIAGGKNILLFEKELNVFATLSHSGSSEYKTGIYKKYRSNVLDNSFTDIEDFVNKVNTAGLVNLNYQLNDNHALKFNSLFVHKTKDGLYEGGRNGEGYVFDQDPQEYGAFVRDQNIKETQLFINQIIGRHTLGGRYLLKWALGYNTVNADEPNRIRNEVNILDENRVQFAHVGDFQQRKSEQTIKDSELNGYLNDEYKFVDEEAKKIKVDFGANFRNKKRDFNSMFIGVRAKGVQVTSIDNMDEALINQSLYNSRDLIVRDRKADTYDAQLDVLAGYLNFGVEFNQLSGSLGVRYEKDQLEASWNVGNYVGRVGTIQNDYNNILPALNLKYALGESSALRLAASKTITLPEFKELAPFEYVSPEGRVIKGNPELQHSDNYNLDLKWEMFPTAKQLISLSGFYKEINNPINLAQSRGSSGNFVFANTGEKANVYGLELETRFHLIKAESSDRPELNMTINATKMWFQQDLLKEFQYNNKTETDLQGAAGFILNSSLSFSNNKEKALMATLTGNYSSDKILALGAPEDFENSTTLFNNEIIEKGFVTVDLVLTKKLSERISIKLTGKNLLNPSLEQTQEIKPLNGEASNEVVKSYRKGIDLNFSVKINLN